ncbi:MAG: flagellar hook-basal body complex protein FliE [Ectothiorhodospira sp.]
MSNTQIDQVLQQMRVMAASAGLDQQQGAGQQSTGTQPSFAAMLRQSMDRVNQYQETSGEMASRFEKGDPEVDLTEVMVAKQKASVSFEATMQVRNRLVSAYQDIMNMQV